MKSQTIALIVLGALGAILAAGLAFGDLSGEAAWATLGGVIGAVGGILAPAPSG
jgi:hypothetical protein